MYQEKKICSQPEGQEPTLKRHESACKHLQAAWHYKQLFSANKHNEKEYNLL